MLDMGFIEDIEKILELTPATRQMMLYSATMAPAIAKIAKKQMKDPLKIAINLKDIVAPKIAQVFYEVAQRDKTEVLTRLLDVESPELTLVFCHTKREVDDVAASLRQLGYNAGALHGDFAQAHREEVMGEVQGRDDRHPRGDRRRGPGDRRREHHARHQLQHPAEPGGVHPPDRPHRAGRPLGDGGHVRDAARIPPAAADREDRPDQAQPQGRPVGGRGHEGPPRQIVADVAAQLEKGTHRPYLDVVRELAATAGPEEVAAAALVLAFGEMKVAELQKRAAAPPPAARPTSVERGMTRLFFTLGRKDRVQTSEILRAIAGESGIQGKRVGKIDIREQFTFVEVPVDIAEKVIAAMDNAFIRGKKIAVKKALPPVRPAEPAAGARAAERAEDRPRPGRSAGGR